MRPMSATAVASVITSAAPPTARLPRWTTCQSFENPSTLEYSHIGETTMRLESVSERKEIGSNRCGIALDYAMRGWGLAASERSSGSRHRKTARVAMEPARGLWCVRIATEALDRLPVCGPAHQRLANPLVHRRIAHA